MPYRISLSPNSESRKARQAELNAIKDEVVEDPIVEEVFDPEAGKPTDNPFPSDVDYSSMTVAELKALCVERGLAQYGTKAELIERLSQSTKAPVEETAVEEDTATPEASAVATENQEEGEVSESDGGTEEE